METDVDDANGKCDTYMIDLAAYIRSIIKQCRTVRDIAIKLHASIPSTYKTVYVVCDRYLEGSIKSSERVSRGEGDRVVLQNPDMKVPYNINSFLSVGKNKEDLFSLIKKVLIEIVRNRTIYFCFRECVEIRENVERTRPDLDCDHEEADTMLIALASRLDGGGIMVRSPSGDIDIVTLFVHHAMAFNGSIY